MLGRTILGLAAIMGSLALPTGSVAQSALGTAFTYQGRLTEGGEPANGVYDLNFSLHDSATSATQVGSTLVQEDVVVLEGLLTVELDFGIGVFSGEARYLEIGVRPGADNGTYDTLGPRQKLTPTPQSLFAVSAGSAPWDGLTGLPSGFGDDVDNDTLYGAGPGLALAGNQFSVDFVGTGVSDTAARSDHNHDRFYSSSSHSHLVNALSDVTVTGVTDNEVLAYDSGSGEWVNQSVAEAGLVSATDISTEAALEATLTDVANVFTDNDTIPEGNLDAALTRDTEWDSEAELEANLADVSDVFTDNDGALTDDDLSDDPLAALSDVVITGVTDNEVLAFDAGSGEWVNQSVAEAGLVSATDISTEAALEGMLTDVADVFTDNDTVPEGNIAVVLTRDTEWDTEAELEANLADVSDVFTDNDGALTDDDLSDDPLAALSDVVITGVTDNEVLAYDSGSGEWVNRSVAEAGLVSVTDVSTEAALEATLTDVANVFTDNDGALDDDDVTNDNVETMATTGALGAVPVSDGAGGLVMTDMLAESELDVEVELEGQLADVTDVFTDNDTIPDGNIAASLHRDSENKDIQFVGNTAGTTSLDETTAADDSGAFLIGAFDEFNNSSSINVQEVLADFDVAISVGSGTFQNVFTTMAVPSGTYPEADSPLDTLQFISGNSISIVGDATADSLTIAVPNGAVTETQLNTSVAGSGLTGGGGSAVAVGAGNAITVAVDTVGVSDDGINGAQLADTMTLDANLKVTGGYDVEFENSLNSGQFLLDFTTDTPTANQKFLAISKGTSSPTEILSLDEDGDLEVAGDLHAAGGFKNTLGTWGEPNIAKNLVAEQLNLFGASTNNELVAPFPGSVVGVSVALDAPRSGGVGTVEVLINGAATGFSTTLDAANSQYNYSTQAKDLDSFNPGDRFSIAVTTNSDWGPTTVDLVATLIVEF